MDTRLVDTFMINCTEICLRKSFGGEVTVLEHDGNNWFGMNFFGSILDHIYDFSSRPKCALKFSGTVLNTISVLLDM